MAIGKTLGKTIFGLLLATVLAGSSSLVAAQETSEEAPAHPAFIQAGDCTDLNDTPVGTLGVVGPMVADSEDEEANQVEGSLVASPVLYSKSEDVELSFDDMLAEAHSVVIHESEAEIQTNISCGEIGGIVVDDKLIVALHSMNESGYTGIAILTKDGDGNVDAEIYLAAPVNPENVPDATPAG